MIVFNTAFYLSSARRAFFFLSLMFLPALFLAATPIKGPAFDGPAAAGARQRLLVTAESYLGTPYRFAGLDRRGLDCSGLVFLSFREGLNQQVPRTVLDFYNWVEKIPVRDLEPGDLVFFTTTGNRISHLGIYAGDNRFIHSASEGQQTGVIYSSMNDAYWRRTFSGAGRALPGNANGSNYAGNSPAGNNPVWNNAAGNNPAGNSSAISRSTGNNTSSANSASYRRPAPLDFSGLTGFYGFGVAWTWGPFFDGLPDSFRGISTQAVIGFRWQNLHAELQLRPEWNRVDDIYRFPVTVAVGTENLRVFGGPAYSSSDSGEWQWDLGFIAESPAISLGEGALSLYAEFAWPPAKSITKNSRLSTGFRYIFGL